MHVRFGQFSMNTICTGANSIFVIDSIGRQLKVIVFGATISVMDCKFLQFLMESSLLITALDTLSNSEQLYRVSEVRSCMVSM